MKAGNPTLFLICSILIFCSCDKSTSLIEPTFTQSDIRINNIKYDSLILKPNKRFYGFGITKFKDSLFYHLDLRYLEIWVFDMEGKYIKTYFSKGKGPNEITSADGFFIDDKRLTVLNSALRTYKTVELKDMLTNGKKIKLQEDYNLGYWHDFPFLPYGEDYIISSIERESHAYNRFSTKRYYESTNATIGLIDSKTGSVVKTFGVRSPEFLKLKFK